MSDARKFVDSMAETLRAGGYPVEVKVSRESFGEFVWLKSRGPHVFSSWLNLFAWRENGTGRWTLGSLKVWSWNGETWVDRTYETRPRIEAAVRNFATEKVRP